MEVGQEFNSCEDFESAIKDICNANNWTFVKHDSKSVNIANKELKSDSQPYSANFRYRYVRFRCKHGGSTRKKERVYDQINGKPILHLNFIYQSCVTTTEREKPACKNTTPPKFVNFNCKLLCLSRII